MTRSLGGAAFDDDAVDGESGPPFDCVSDFLKFCNMTLPYSPCMTNAVTTTGGAGDPAEVSILSA